MRTVSKVATVFLVIFLIWNIFVYFTNRDTQELARVGSIKEQISATGWLIKNEVLIPAPADGVLQPYVSDCEKIGNSMNLAAILSGETDEAARARLTVINSRISSLRDALANPDFENDLIGLDDSIDSNIEKIIKAGSQGKMTNISFCKNEIIKLVDKRRVVDGAGETILANLENEKKSLESKLGNLINEIVSPKSGVFSARLDGLEETLTPNAIEWLLPSDFTRYKNVKGNTQSDVLKGDNVCKIMDNFEWYLAVPLESKDTEKFAVGKIMRIVFRDAGGESAPAEIFAISEDEAGKKVVTFKINRDIGGILSRRNVSIDIILNTYEGLKVPTAALCMEGDQTGVYVQNGGDKVFKKIEIIYHNNDYMIIKEDNSAENSLLLYDNVIVKGDVK